MTVRGIRGAITVEANSKESILEGTKELLLAMQKENQFNTTDIVSIFFSMTPDLNAAFPAEAARQLGWRMVPLFDTQEIPVVGSLPQCIRILILINSQKSQLEIKHCYLRESQVLRADLTEDISEISKRSE
ncbi:MAG: chorismate mutase [Candidatus Caldatribacteriota bacterium]